MDRPDCNFSMQDEIVNLTQEMAGIMKDDYIPVWWSTPLEVLRGMSPMEALAKGRHEEVRRIVYYLGSGIPI